METKEIKKISKQNISGKNITEIANILEKKYKISVKNLESTELKKAIDEKNPFFINDHFIIGYDEFNNGDVFYNDRGENVSIERMVKAVIVEDPFDQEPISDDADYFAIINKNTWGDIEEFSSVISPLRVNKIFLPPHSAVFNFIEQSEEEKKNKIVSSLEGVNINIYDRENYIGNCFHEIGHLFYRDCLTTEEKSKFKQYFKILIPSAIYEYDWERSDSEEMFCTIYKWYLKSILLNPSFMNILEFEDPKGLSLLQSVFDRIRSDKINVDTWNLSQNILNDYLNPKRDHLGRKVRKTGLLDEIRNLEVPQKILTKAVDRFENNTLFVNIENNVLPVKEKKILFDYEVDMKKATDKKTIFMDMDGVVADFVQGFKRNLGVDPVKLDSFTTTQYCLQDSSFFRYLPVLPQGRELFYLLDNEYKIVFLTTPMEGMINSKIDKIDWVQENFGNYDVIFSDKKYEFAKDHESILIDDMDYNLIPWNENGGTSIKFPQKNEKIMSQIDNVFNPNLSQIKLQLKNIDTNTNPTESQKITGIYKKGKIVFKNLDIRIENPKGSIRSGIGSRGEKWVQKMKSHYGYITGTEGADYDPVDVFLGDKLNASRCFVVNQKSPDNMFDEHKVVLAVDNIDEAKEVYLSNYSKNWDGIMSISPTNTKKLREWLQTGNKHEPFPGGINI